ncbi:efflux RND transporter periplasmic adaptor subunit [Oceanomicrobium pacificus]|uniref:Efflux RND transporter periplasmic adaptor subunit n=1 Tax=Oceanomicrobium pacificus TaxID=2692916 RepID=A0A6B0TX92_9RHOB|nr:efflux RND transporter periplasmic adaptor subunit [Oceanomicrobium pacificus]MXU65643.1 efflux RND transporter periplasmic adaptor subunit [Oceanomicrobium pacificus]
MKILPLITAALVALTLYFVVMERDALRAFAAGEDVVEVVDETVINAPDEDNPPVSVVAMTSVARTVDNGIVLRGRTEAVRRVDVLAETTGLVISEPTRKGSRVEKGQLLCELDEGTKPAELAEARARLVEAEANNTASAKLVERGFTSETAAIARKAQLESAQAAVKQAEKNIARLQITAPFDGLLESDTAEFGQLLQPGSACATILDLSRIKLVGFVPEKDISGIRVGGPAAGRLISGEDVTGIVTFASRSADAQTRTFRIEVEVNNPDGLIRDGSTAEIMIPLDGVKAHLLPQSALTLDDNGRLGVRIDVDGVARFNEVSVIRDAADGIWVSGLPDEVDVIVVGQDFVTDGRAIDVTLRGDG